MTDVLFLHPGQVLLARIKAFALQAANELRARDLRAAGVPALANGGHDERVRDIETLQAIVKLVELVHENPEYLKNICTRLTAAIATENKAAAEN